MVRVSVRSNVSVSVLVRVTGSEVLGSGLRLGRVRVMVKVLESG